MRYRRVTEPEHFLRKSPTQIIRALIPRKVLSSVTGPLLIALSICQLTFGVTPSQPETADAPQATAEGLDQRDVTVGMSGQITQIVLPGSRLIPKEVDPRKTAIVLRIDEVYPHGDTYRYDFTWFGLEPGTHDLRDFLSREDGSPTTDLPSIKVNVNSVLPNDTLRPNDVTTGFLARIGGYRVVVIIAVAVWVVGLLAILFVGKPRRDTAAADQQDTAIDPVDHICRLVDRALATGELSTEEKADLDVRIMNFWRERRDLGDRSLSESLSALKNDEEAGPLLNGLERWLYSKTPPNANEIKAMLQPLRQLAARQPGPPPLASTGAAT